MHRASRISRVASPLFAVLLLTAPALAQQRASAPTWSSAVPPACAGPNGQAAARFTKEGLDHYRRGKSGNNTTEFTAALASFDAACAEGNGLALEYRAYALAALHRWLEAAETLDTFLATHPLDGLSDDVRSRVMPQQEEILHQVASLTIELKGSDSARISIDHRDFGDAPLHDLRLPIGTHDVTVTPKVGAATLRTLELAEGKHLETFDFSAKATAPATAVEPTPEVNAPKSLLLPLSIGTGVGAVVLAGVGVGMLAWMNGAVQRYDSTCVVHNAPSSCSDLLSEFELSRNLAVGTFAAAGVAGALSAAFFVMFTSRPKTLPPPAMQEAWLRGVWCSPRAGVADVGLSCGGAW